MAAFIIILLQVLPYELLMKQLDISNVRELEDMLINDCMYAVSDPLVNNLDHSMNHT